MPQQQGTQEFNTFGRCRHGAAGVDKGIGEMGLPELQNTGGPQGDDGGLYDKGQLQLIFEAIIVHSTAINCVGFNLTGDDVCQFGQFTGPPQEQCINYRQANSRDEAEHHDN
ncbi:MAG: hypothetical protein OSB58_22540 [Alphaproteobacteria bacterium]|nr:hypothetical protein [Alphaproteobacteria bacterium]